MTIAIIPGTRPEIIKMAPIIGGSGAGGYQHRAGRRSGRVQAAHQGGPRGDGPEKLRSHHARGDQTGGSGSHFRLSMLFPVHPRTRKMAAEFGFEFDGIRAIEPLGFLEFLQLEARAWG